ncbi:GDP-L-fucose synthase [Mycolicibacterium sp.]|uniref:GDP-L-fucose synthase family protein n=1 Tax=Mycolicibacterium sp. TaxID=2320850 RepID=UPI0025D5A938|nr:GDP-L-fucose synthase [Mycolicibacterium sp.]MCB9409828.1 GDP-L-fucose synthase [Mycolicibacterium sp.]
MTDDVSFTPGELDRRGAFYVAGHRGLAGSAVVRRLQQAGFDNIVTRTSGELDLRDRDPVFEFFAATRPRYVVLAAAKVGGILANSTYPVDFLSDNLRIQVNVLDAAREAGVERLLFLGSSCIYPKFAEQPIREDALLTGPLEPTNDAYAIAKIGGILHVQAVRRQYGLPWISAMPTNLYGPNDNFSPTGSHVLPALIRRYDEATRSDAASVTNWGTGSPRREFLHSDDLADACLHLLEHYDGAQHVNVGSGTDLTIRAIAETIAGVVGFTGATFWDTSKPDGTHQKLMDVSKLAQLGWTAKIGLQEGIERTVAWYREHVDSLRG